MDYKLISDYTGLNFKELSDLDVITFKYLFRDAYIYTMNQTEEGRKYLEKCYRLNQTSADYDSLKNFSKGMNNE
jgi:hypothetical protein